MLQLHDVLPMQKVTRMSGPCRRALIQLGTTIKHWKRRHNEDVVMLLSSSCMQRAFATQCFTKSLRAAVQASAVCIQCATVFCNGFNADGAQFSCTLAFLGLRHAPKRPQPTLSPPCSFVLGPRFTPNAAPRPAETPAQEMFIGPSQTMRKAWTSAALSCAPARSDDNTVTFCSMFTAAGAAVLRSGNFDGSVAC